MGTPRFGLTDTTDNERIDRVLAAYEVHDHKGGERLADPDLPPEAFLATIGGVLPGSTTYFYRFSLVDRFGFESAASPEIAVVTPAQVRAPGTPVVVSAANGLLQPGLYYTYLTALLDDEETELSQPTFTTLVPGEGTLVVAMPEVIDPGVTGFQVWRQGPGETGPSRIGVVAVNELGIPASQTYLDDGSVPPDDCPCDPDNLPPALNETNASNKITITLPGEFDEELADVEKVSRWRLYRATRSGGYSANSRVAEVIRDSGTGELPNNFADDGRSPVGLGGPLDTSETLVPSVKIRGGGGGGGGLSLVLGSAARWKVYCDVNGQLITRGTDAAKSSGVVLVDADNVRWRLDVAADGSLFIDSNVTLVNTDIVYTLLEPLVLPTPDPTFVYAVSVVDTSLATQEA